MCPLTCKIVKQAIEAHENMGVIMQEYVDMHKEHDLFCNNCTRNEKEENPVLDKGVEDDWK